MTRNWFHALPGAEQSRRRQFKMHFKPARTQFEGLPLSNARHVSQHRIGFPSMEVTVVGRFGVTYIGNPVKRVPDAEIRTISDPTLQWMADDRSVQVPVPNWADFKIDGQPLFESLLPYLDAASTLIREAREIALQVHGTEPLSPPPPG